MHENDFTCGESLVPMLGLDISFKKIHASSVIIMKPSIQFCFPKQQLMADKKVQFLSFFSHINRQPRLTNDNAGKGKYVNITQTEQMLNTKKEKEKKKPRSPLSVLSHMQCKQS